jgi:hypothetical protein
MKKVLAYLAIAASLTFVSRAADKEVTITGKGVCAKCELKEAKKCQNAIQVEKGGKTVTYYLVDNDVSKSFHKNICQESEEVTATGTVKKVDGKMELTATKIAKK